jgi:ribosome maturation factor RimP
MTLSEKLTEALLPIVVNSGFLLEEVKVTPIGKRRLIVVIIDRELSNPSLDEVTSVSQLISEELEEFEPLGEQPFTLEVTTPGVDRPLTQPRHWRKNKTRLVKILLLNGDKLQGRITEVLEERVILDTSAKELTVNFSEIERATIEVEFNRKDAQ